MPIGNVLNVIRGNGNGNTQLYGVFDIIGSYKYTGSMASFADGTSYNNSAYVDPTTKQIHYDSLGNLYINCITHIKKLSTSGFLSVFSSGYTSILDFVIDNLNNLYIRENSPKKLFKIDVNGNLLNSVDRPTDSYPYGFCINKSGSKIYWIDGGKIYEYDTSTNSSILFVSVSFPVTGGTVSDLKIDSNDNLYLCWYMHSHPSIFIDTNIIYKCSPSKNVTIYKNIAKNNRIEQYDAVRQGYGDNIYRDPRSVCYTGLFIDQNDTIYAINNAKKSVSMLGSWITYPGYIVETGFGCKLEIHNLSTTNPTIIASNYRCNWIEILIDDIVYSISSTPYYITGYGNKLTILQKDSRDYNCIRTIDKTNNKIKTILGGGDIKNKNLIGSVINKENTALLFNPTSMSINTSNDLFIADSNTIRKWSNSNQKLTTIYGKFLNNTSVNGVGDNIRFKDELIVLEDSNKNLFVKDSAQTIRKIDNTENCTDFINTPATQFLVIDSSDYLYTATKTSIKKISPSGSIIDTIGSDISSGDVLGDKSNTRFTNITCMYMHKNNNLFVIDSITNTTKKLKMINTSGLTTFIIDYGSDNINSFAVDNNGNYWDICDGIIRRNRRAMSLGGKYSLDKSLSKTYFNNPKSLVISNDGLYIFVIDSKNNLIRKIDISLF